MSCNLIRGGHGTSPASLSTERVPTEPLGTPAVTDIPGKVVNLMVVHPQCQPGDDCQATAGLSHQPPQGRAQLGAAQSMQFSAGLGTLGGRGGTLGKCLRVMWHVMCNTPLKRQPGGLAGRTSYLYGAESKADPERAGALLKDSRKPRVISGAPVSRLLLPRRACQLQPRLSGEKGEEICR